MSDALITGGFDKPPYHVESFPIGSCVCNVDGFNVLSFHSKPGAKFTTPEAAQAICNEWNNRRTQP